MPFQKGNKLATVTKGEVKPKTEQWNNIVGWLVGDGGSQYKQALQDLASDKPISKPRQEFLEHYETLLEFHQPKLARQEVKQDLRVGHLVDEKQAQTILKAVDADPTRN